MCGRFYVDHEMLEEIKRIVIRIPKGSGRTGDIVPSGKSMVVVGERDELALEEMQWGFLQSNRKGLLINARAETIQERASFSDSVRKRRCVIPARGFYEWDRDKNKVTFHRFDSRILYMAGIYRAFDGADHFCIITTRANPSVVEIHDRMPLLLEEEEVKEWICREADLETVLQKVPLPLEHHQEYEQQRLILE